MTPPGVVSSPSLTVSRNKFVHLCRHYLSGRSLLVCIEKQTTLHWSKAIWGSNMITAEEDTWHRQFGYPVYYFRLDWAIHRCLDICLYYYHALEQMSRLNSQLTLPDLRDLQKISCRWYCTVSCILYYNQTTETIYIGLYLPLYCVHGEGTFKR